MHAAKRSATLTASLTPSHAEERNAHQSAAEEAGI